MDRDLKIQDIAGAAVFGALGLAALAGVIFAGAKHQLVMVGICAAMVWAFIAEIRREEKRAKAKNTVNQ
ncbi:MAG: hypothetical protein LBU80_01110 [Rikenellaceae bacterium]|jgi:hypothetical protein|nr:hypothetical protein [Rikenellaceae bacterium]